MRFRSCYRAQLQNTACTSPLQRDNPASCFTDDDHALTPANTNPNPKSKSHAFAFMG